MQNMLCKLGHGLVLSCGFFKVHIGRNKSLNLLFKFTNKMFFVYLYALLFITLGVFCNADLEKKILVTGKLIAVLEMLFDNIFFTVR